MDYYHAALAAMLCLNAIALVWVVWNVRDLFWDMRAAVNSLRSLQDKQIDRASRDIAQEALFKAFMQRQQDEWRRG